MVKVCRLPRRSGMTFLAALRQAQRKMVRVAGFLIVGKMATYAGCRRSLILPSNVAGRAVERGVHSGKREERVIELRAQPVIHRMTLLALHRKRRRRCRVAGRRGLLVRRLVAGVALHREALELPNRCSLVTVGTIQTRVSTY